MWQSRDRARFLDCFATLAVTARRRSVLVGINANHFPKTVLKYY